MFPALFFPVLFIIFTILITRRSSRGFSSQPPFLMYLHSVISAKVCNDASDGQRVLIMQESCKLDARKELRMHLLYTIKDSTFSRSKWKIEFTREKVNAVQRK